jgi:stage V sporulation protein B
MVSVVIGEAAGLLFLFLTFKRSRKKQRGALAFPSQPLQADGTLWNLLRIGLPMTSNGLIYSLFRAFLPMLVTTSLLQSGVGTAAMATKQFGLLTGYVFPLLFLPGFFTQSLTTALVPAISEAAANRNHRLIHLRMDQAMRIALLVGAPSTVFLYFWALPLTTVIYQAPDAAPLLKVLAPVFFLRYFEAPLHAILLGLGKAATIMWNFIATNLLEAAAIFILGANFGIRGVAMGIGCGICVITVLNFYSISKKIGFYLNVRDVLKTVLCVLVMTVIGLGSSSFLQRSGTGLIWNLLGTVLVSLLAYAAMLQVTGMLRVERRLPVPKPLR